MSIRVSRPKIHPFFSETSFICPRCEKIFKHKDMWNKIVDMWNNVTDISKAMGYSLPTVTINLRRYKLVRFVDGTREICDWHNIAHKLGFRTPRDMFYNFKVIRNMSFRSMCRQIDYDPEDIKTLKIACRDFLNPRWYKNKPEARLEIKKRDDRENQRK